MVEYLTLEEFAAKLRISPEAARLILVSGAVEGAGKAGPGRTSPWRVPAESVAAYIRRQAVRAAS